MIVCCIRSKTANLKEIGGREGEENFFPLYILSLFFWNVKEQR